jgi:tetratricopeptide (TPR) repeat protein
MRTLLLVLPLAAALSTLPGVSVRASDQNGIPPAQVEKQLAAFEAQLSADPENLRAGAQYRQHAIAIGAYDRAIKFLEKLSRRPDAGAHAYMTLALAYVDKVPDVGAIRQAYIGRDAIGALTKSLDREKDFVALYIRGLINLYYDTLIFKRTDKGVADLEQAREMTLPRREPWVARVYVALGDGYWRVKQPDRARATWREGLTRFPNTAPLAERLNATDAQVRGIIAHALDPNVRVDTSLRELFPDVVPFSALVSRQ